MKILTAVNLSFCVIGDFTNFEAFDGLIFQVEVLKFRCFFFAAYQPGGAPPPSSTNRPIKNGQVLTKSGELSGTSTPQAIETEGVAHFVEEYRVAARNAIEAGKHTYLSNFNTISNFYLNINKFIVSILLNA